MMTYLNQFHQEAVERKQKKIEESLKKPMDPIVDRGTGTCHPAVLHHRKDNSFIPYYKIFG